MKSKNLIIVGDSAFAQIAHEYFEHDSDYNVVAFSVETSHLKDVTLRGLPVVPFEDLQDIYNPSDYYIFVAVTYSDLNRLRTRLLHSARAKGYTPASYISSRAFVWKNALIGDHCFIFENNTIQPFVEVSDNVIMWSGNHIGHHSKIRQNCFISSHVVVSGFCTIGPNSFIGVNATLSNNLVLDGDNWIGPSSLVTRGLQMGALVKADSTDISKTSTYRFFKLNPGN